VNQSDPLKENRVLTVKELLKIASVTPRIAVMVANLTTIISSPISALGASFAIGYRVPSRILRNILIRLRGREPGTSLWIAFSSALFSAAFDYNWRLVLVRPRWISSCDGFRVPSDSSESEKLGFQGFLYVNDEIKKQAIQPTLIGADAVWIHAHGGGFMAGEARQYHTTYRRWIRRALDLHGLDLRILAVEYRKGALNLYD
jgi:hypothetical protein